MKNLNKLLFTALVLAVSSCGINNNAAKNSPDTSDSLATVTVDSTSENGLLAADSYFYIRIRKPNAITPSGK
jgi:hypothetical protein